MKQLIYFIAITVFIQSCREEENNSLPIEYPSSFRFESSEFEGSIETYSSRGAAINAQKKYVKEDFLFSEGSVYPIDRIDFISQTDIVAYFSDPHTSFIKSGKYRINSKQIDMEIYFTNSANGTLFISAEHNISDEFRIKAFGFKTYGPNDTGGTIENNVSEFGENWKRLLTQATPKDTIYIQNFYEVYKRD